MKSIWSLYNSPRTTALEHGQKITARAGLLACFQRCHLLQCPDRQGTLEIIKCPAMPSFLHFLMFAFWIAAMHIYLTFNGNYSPKSFMVDISVLMAAKSFQCSFPIKETSLNNSLICILGFYVLGKRSIHFICSRYCLMFCCFPHHKKALHSPPTMYPWTHAPTFLHIRSSELWRFSLLG